MTETSGEVNDHPDTVGSTPQRQRVKVIRCSPNAAFFVELTIPGLTDEDEWELSQKSFDDALALYRADLRCVYEIVTYYGDPAVWHDEGIIGPDSINRLFEGYYFWSKTQRIVALVAEYGYSDIELRIDKRAKMPPTLIPTFKYHCHQHNVHFRKKRAGKSAYKRSDVSLYAAYRGNAGPSVAKTRSSADESVQRRSRAKKILSSVADTLRRKTPSTQVLYSSIRNRKAGDVRRARSALARIATSRVLIELDDTKKRPDYFRDPSNYVKWRLGRLEAIDLDEKDIAYYGNRPNALLGQPLGASPENTVVLNDLNGLSISIVHIGIALICRYWYLLKLKLLFFKAAQPHREIVLKEKLQAALATHRVYSFIQDRRGAIKLFKACSPTDVVQAQAISRQARLHVKIANKMGHRTTYFADRILGPRRLSNLPTELADSFQDTGLGYPYRYVVIDESSRNLLRDYGVPNQRIFMYHKSKKACNVIKTSLRNRTAIRDVGVVIILQTFQSGISEFVHLGQVLSGLEGVSVQLREHPNFRFSEEGRDRAKKGAQGTLEFQDPSMPIDGADIYITGFSTAVTGPATEGAAVIWYARANPLCLLLEEFFTEIALKASTVEECCTLVRKVACGENRLIDEVEVRQRNAVEKIGSADGVRTLRDLVEM